MPAPNGRRALFARRRKLARRRFRSSPADKREQGFRCDSLVILALTLDPILQPGSAVRKLPGHFECGLFGPPDQGDKIADAEFMSRDGHVAARFVGLEFSQIIAHEPSFRNEFERPLLAAKFFPPRIFPPRGCALAACRRRAWKEKAPGVARGFQISRRAAPLHS